MKKYFKDQFPNVSPMKLKRRRQFLHKMRGKIYQKTTTDFKQFTFMQHHKKWR